MYSNRLYKKAKTKRFKQNKKAVKRALLEHYEKKSLLCDNCNLCRLSVEEIKANYEEILTRIGKV